MSGRTWFTGPMEWSTGNSYQAEALTNVLKYHTCRSSHPEDRKLPITELKWDVRSKKPCSGRSKLPDVQQLWLNFRPLPVSRIAWYTCIIPQNVCFGPPWGPEGNENIGKPSYFNLSPNIGFTLFTPIKGRIDSLTVYIYKAETCTNILRYNTCMIKPPWHPILAP
jgi:hypothetical protein